MGEIFKNNIEGNLKTIEFIGDNLTKITLIDSSQVPEQALLYFRMEVNDAIALGTGYARLSQTKEIIGGFTKDESSFFQKFECGNHQYLVETTIGNAYRIRKQHKGRIGSLTVLP